MYGESIQSPWTSAYVHHNNGEQFYEGEREETNPKRGMEKH